MDLKQEISKFDEVALLLQELKILKVQERRKRRRLNTVLKKYSFLNNLVCIDGKDEIIEDALVNYFKELGFNNIKKVGKKFKEEDLRLFVNDKLIIFEVTGTKNINNTDDKSHQISKYIPLRKIQYSNLNVFGVFVSNHDNKKQIELRNKVPFDNRSNKIASASEYSLTTTTDLFHAFIKIKKGLLTPDELIDKLCKFGKLKI